MTTLTYAVSRAIGRTLKPGDEIVVTRLDHDANVAPWLALEEERGIRVRWVEIRRDDCTLDLEGLERTLGPRTRLVAVGLASNAVGTLNPVPRIVEMAHSVGALTYVDAVHAATHLAVDVAALGTDFLVCSPYKFFGPHLGMLYGRRELLEGLAAYKVRPAVNEPPGKWETGTLPGESLAGCWPPSGIWSGWARRSAQPGRAARVAGPLAGEVQPGRAAGHGASVLPSGHGRSQTLAPCPAARPGCTSPANGPATRARSPRLRRTSRPATPDTRRWPATPPATRPAECPSPISQAAR